MGIVANDAANLPLAGPDRPTPEYHIFPSAPYITAHSVLPKVTLCPDHRKPVWSVLIIAPFGFRLLCAMAQGFASECPHRGSDLLNPYLARPVSVGGGPQGH